MAGSHFGYAVAANRSLAAVGAPYDSEAGPRAGAVYIFVAASNVTWSWAFVQKVYPAPGSPGHLGTSVAVSESTGIVVASSVPSLANAGTQKVRA